MKAQVYADIVPDRSFFVAIFLTLFTVASSLTNSSMSAPYIVGDIGGSAEVAVFAICFYGLGTALTVPLGKVLIARIGLGNTFVGCLIGTVFLDLICSLSTNYPVYLFQRFCLGCLVGPLFAAMRFSIETYSRPEKSLKAVALFVSILTIAPAIGAAWGGVIAYFWTWRVIYLIDLLVYALLALFYMSRFKNTHITCPKKEFDAIGYSFFFIGLFLLSFTIITAQYFDWYRCRALVAFTLIGIPCLIFFVLWSLYHPSPILDIRMFKKFSFAFAMINMAVFFSAYFGMVILIALWLKLYVSYDPRWIGIIIGSMGLAGCFPWFILEDRFKKIDHRIYISIGIALFALSCFHTSTFDADVNFGRIAFSRVIAGLGIAIFLPSIFLTSFESFAAEKSLDVLQMFQVVRNLAAALGAGCYDIVWQRRQIFFHERLGEKLNVFSLQTAQFFQRVQQYNTPGDPNEQLGFWLDRQSTALALEDSFWLMSWILVALMVFCIVTMRRKLFD